jgi:hypothetical protein
MSVKNTAITTFTVIGAIIAILILAWVLIGIVGFVVYQVSVR